VNKRNELVQVIAAYNPMILGLTESWLQSDVADSELDCGRYSVYRRDRCDRAGGGVALLIDDKLPVIERHDIFEHTGFREMVWCRVTVNGNQTLLVGCVYKSPTSSETENDQLTNCYLYGE